MKKKFTKQKGITLIALIITIIVMLILVGVTINVAINGGLFTKAKNAAEQTQVEADKETLLSAAMACIGTDGKVVFTGADGLDSHLPAGFSGSNGTYTKGEYTYTVNPNTGKITATKSTANNPSNLTDLEKYILGADGQGRELISEESANGILSMETMIFGQDPQDTSSTVYQDVKLAYIDGDTGEIYIRYGRDVYKFGMGYDDGGTVEDESDDQYLTVAGSLQFVRTPAGNLGKYVTYNGNTWIVLSDDENGVELIRANAIGSVTLGGNDFAEARTSYNSAITTLVNACKSQTSISSNIRNVGGPATDQVLTADDPLTTNENECNTVDFSELETFTPNVADSNFAQYEGTTNGLLIGDENYLTDYNKMKTIGILTTDIPADYWLASRFVRGNSSRVDFSIRFVYNEGSFERPQFVLCGLLRRCLCL